MCNSAFHCSAGHSQAFPLARILGRMNKMSPVVEEGLNPQQQKFADVYLECGRVEKAALAAGYSHKSAHVTGSRLLRNAKVAEYISRRQNAVATKAEKLEDRLIEELGNLAFSNIGDFVTVDDEGLPQIDFSRATRAQLAAINSVSTKRTKRYDAKGKHIATETNAKFGLSSKHESIRTLMQFKGMLKPEEHKVTLDVSDRLLRARARLQSGDTQGSGEAEQLGGSDTSIVGTVLGVTEKPGGGGTGV